MPELPARPSSVNNCTAPAGGASTPCTLSDVVVEFRPLTTYQGAFGFDWLRVTEAPTSYANERAPYIDNPGVAGTGAIITGYKTHTTPSTTPITDEYTAIEAQEKIKGRSSSTGEYEKFHIVRSATTHRHLTYYIPYLNLYPKTDNGNPLIFTIPTGLGTLPEPPTSAELRMIIDVKGTAPSKIELEFNTDYFEVKVAGAAVSNPYLIPDDGINYTPTPDSAATSKEVINSGSTHIIEITCLKAFSSDQSINVYSYHTQTSPTIGPQPLKQKLAGQLIICANNRANRKIQKVVLVEVKTNTTGGSTAADIKTGKFSFADINYLYRILYQALIYPDVFPKKLDGTRTVLFDVTGDAELTTTTNATTGAITFGRYIDETNTTQLKDQPIGAEGIPAYIRRKFLTKPEFAKYTDYLTIFSLEVSLPDAGGEADYDEAAKKFLKNVSIYIGRKDSAMAHEMVHGLGIYHTHRDGDGPPDLDDYPIEFKNKKYVFPYPDPIANYIKATSNIMSYRDDGDRYSTWRWQWTIMKDNIT